MPFLLGRDKAYKDVASGLLWAQASDTFVDIFPSQSGRRTAHFISESGTLEFYLLSGVSPKDVLRKQGSLLGETPLPALWTLGYSQSRWSYKSQEEVLGISDKFVEHKIPCDGVWLDVDHTDDKRFYTWNLKDFPSPREMLDHVVNKNKQRLFTIIDPQVKIDSDYFVYAEA